MRSALVAVLALFFALPMHGVDGASLRVDYSNPSLFPSQWTLVLHPDGTGHFHAEGGIKPQDESDVMLPAAVDRDVNLNRAFADRVFQTVRHHKLFQAEPCESHLKVAFQGWKKLNYSGPDGQGGCEFNYSKNKDIQELGDSLVAVSATLIEGARLELLLGLDKAIQYMVEASDDGRLQQMCAIKDILERLENDPHVLDRVRKRARILLARDDK
jgi:hypothetical protein